MLECQEECLRNPACVAYMWGPDADEPCQDRLPEAQALLDAQGLSCPEKPLEGCRQNYCVLLSGYYEVVEYDDKGRAHPGEAPPPALRGRAGRGPPGLRPRPAWRRRRSQAHHLRTSARPACVPLGLAGSLC